MICLDESWTFIMSAYQEMSQTVQDLDYINDADNDINDYAEENGNNGGNKSAKHKFGKIIYFASNSLSKNIVHAETNTQYDFKPGSFESLQLYNVILSTNTDKNDSLYYNSPEEYGLHRGIQIDKQDAKSWHSQKERLFPGGKFDKIAYETVRLEKIKTRVKDQEARRNKANKEAEQFHELIEQIKETEAKSKKPRKYRFNRMKVINKLPMNNPLRNSWIIENKMRETDFKLTTSQC